MSELSESFDNLDKDQFQIAVEGPDNLLVEAAPGAGKTRTLVAKALANCLKRPIYVLTFTTSAAEEIDGRLQQVLSTSQEYAEEHTAWKGIRFVGTLHSWCLGYLRSSGRSDEVIDEEGAKAVALEVCERLRLKLTQKRMVELMGGEPAETAADRQFVSAVDKTMTENGLITYDGLLIETAEYLKREALVWRNPPLFLVDEVQDSSLDDLEIYDQLHESGADLWLVGDLQQAIYSFRHPRPADVWNWWGGLPVIDLKTNYRSSRAVVKALNYINAEFHPRLEIWPGPDAIDGDVKLFTSANQHIQLVEISNRVFSLIHRQHGRADAAANIAVLCRTNRECGLVSGALKSYGLPVRQKKPELPERVPQILWAALGFFRQPSSDWMAKRYLRAIGTDEDTAHRHAIQSMKSIGRMTFPALFASDLTPTEWRKWMDILQVPKVEQGWFLDRVPEGWTDYSWDDIMLRLFEGPREQEVGTGVTVTTVHAAKGREWAHVILPFCDQYSYRPKNGVEEERVFFVGASRAAETLSFLYSKTRKDEWKGEIDVAMCAPLERVVDGARQRKQG